MSTFLQEFTPEDFTGNLGALFDDHSTESEIKSAKEFLHRVYESAANALTEKEPTKRYWANCLIDRHGLSSSPYHQSHYTCCLNIEEARKIIEKFRANGGVLLSYIQEYVGDEKTPNILELKSYVDNLGMGRNGGNPRELKTVKDFVTILSHHHIIVHEIKDDVWAKRFIGDTLFDGDWKDCPEEILRRKVMKVWDSDEDEEKARKFIVFKEDEVI